MFILPKTARDNQTKHLPIVFDNNLFEGEVELNKISMPYKVFLLSFTFSWTFSEYTDIPITITDWQTAIERLGDWVIYNRFDGFIVENSNQFVELDNLNWQSTIGWFYGLFDNLRKLFGGVQNWVKVNDIFGDWESYGMSGGYYLSYPVIDFVYNYLDEYLSTLGWYAFVYLDRFDCRLLKDVLDVIPIEQLLNHYTSGLGYFKLLYDTNLRHKYGEFDVIQVNPNNLSDFVIIDPDGRLAEKKKKFFNVIINILTQSFTSYPFSKMFYGLVNEADMRECIKTEGIGFNVLEDSVKYNAYIKSEVSK